MSELEEEQAGGTGEWVSVAVLGRVRGNRGELTAVPLSSNLERYQQLRAVNLFHEKSGVNTPFEVESVWLHDGRPIFKFRGIDTISDAEPLQGAEVRIPLGERAEQPEGEYYQSDLIGCSIIEQQSGRRLGRVIDCKEYGGPLLLEVQLDEGGDMLVPFVRAICVTIDIGARHIVVDLPEGLKELNQP